MASRMATMKHSRGTSHPQSSEALRTYRKKTWRVTMTVRTAIAAITIQEETVSTTARARS